jgi:hypothetical protein
MRKRNRFKLAFGQTRRGKKDRRLSRMMRRRNKWFRDNHDELLELELNISNAMDAASVKDESEDPVVKAEGQTEMKELTHFVALGAKEMLRQWREIKAQKDNEEDEMSRNPEIVEAV